jgi:hypothetical protein
MFSVDELIVGGKMSALQGALLGALYAMTDFVPITAPNAGVVAMAATVGSVPANNAVAVAVAAGSLVGAVVGIMLFATLIVVTGTIVVVAAVVAVPVQLSARVCGAIITELVVVCSAMLAFTVAVATIAGAVAAVTVQGAAFMVACMVALCHPVLNIVVRLLACAYGAIIAVLSILWSAALGIAVAVAAVTAQGATFIVASANGRARAVLNIAMAAWAALAAQLAQNNWFGGMRSRYKKMCGGAPPPNFPAARRPPVAELYSAFGVFEVLAMLPELTNGRPVRYRPASGVLSRTFAGAARLHQIMDPRVNALRMMPESEKTFKACFDAVMFNWLNILFVPDRYLAGTLEVATVQCFIDMNNFIPRALFHPNGRVGENLREVLSLAGRVDRDRQVGWLVDRLRQEGGGSFDATTFRDEKFDGIVGLRDREKTLDVCLHAVSRHWTYMAFVPDDLVLAVTEQREFAVAAAMLCADMIGLIPQVLLADVSERLLR